MKTENVPQIKKLLYVLERDDLPFHIMFTDTESEVWIEGLGNCKLASDVPPLQDIVEAERHESWSKVSLLAIAGMLAMYLLFVVR